MEPKENRAQPAMAPDAEKHRTNPSVDEFFKRLDQEMRRVKPEGDPLTAAMQAIQRMDEESAAESVVNQSSAGMESSGRICPACGNRNRQSNKFCATCGNRLVEERPSSVHVQEHSATRRTTGEPVHENAPSGQHHYHHHYHHHFFEATAGSEHPEAAMGPRLAGTERVAKEVAPVRAPLTGPGMSRAEATVRKLTQELALACNTKQLDDLVNLYSADGLVMRANTPTVRGSAAIREFFFSALASGLCEVEMETLRVEIIGDVAYEAGRYKMLAPSATGKRREERGKYLIVYQRRGGGEWKILTDCWSSDLTLNTAGEAETGRTSAVPPRAGMPRKSA